MDRDFRESEVLAHRGRRHRRGLLDQPVRTAAEGDGCDLLNPRHRDQDERGKQRQAQRQREGRAEHEIMPVPVGEHGRHPGADAIGGCRQQQRLQHGRLDKRQDRQRHQDADQKRDRSELPVVGIDDRTCPRKFRLAVSLEDSPVRTDAAFEIFPGPVHSFDDVVFHADGRGPRNEVPQHRCLLEHSGIGIAQIVAGARPAEFRDHDALAGKGLAQDAIEVDRLVDRLLGGIPLPVRQHVSGDKIDRIGELGIVAPEIPDLAGGHGHVDRPS